MPPNFWLPPDLNITFVVLSIGAIGSYILAYYYRKKALKYKGELDFIRSKYHSDTNLINPHTSKIDSKATNNKSKGKDICSNIKG